jgi:FHS family Na+ dependent glucose MFS transporter 1
MYLRGPPKNFHMRQPSGKWKKMLHPSICGHGYTFFAVELLIMLFLYFINTVGGERAMSKFLFSYAIDTEVQFTKDDASSLQTAFWGSFTAGRLLGIPIARFLPIWIFILCDVVGVAAVAVAFSIYGYKNRQALWITSSFMGLLIAVAFPNGMAWSNIYLTMNNISVMILIVGGACGGFIYQYLTGYLYNLEPKNLGYVMVGYGIAMVLTFAVMQILATVHGRTILKNDNNKDNVDDIIVEKSETYLGADNLAYSECTRM